MWNHSIFYDSFILQRACVEDCFCGFLKRISNSNLAFWQHYSILILIPCTFREKLYFKEKLSLDVIFMQVGITRQILVAKNEKRRQILTPYSYQKEKLKRKQLSEFIFQFYTFNFQFNAFDFLQYLLQFTIFYFNSSHDGGPYHIETSPLICSANQWTGFCMLGTSVMNELNAVTGST